MKKRIVVLVAIVAVLIAAFWIVRARRANGASTYRFTQVEQGDVTQVVSTTGTLQAIKSVQVGTQVSGQLSAIYVDFNDHVRKGQLIARIDPTLLQQEVRSAEASVERASASLDEKRREFERDTLLFARKVLSESDFETARYNYRVALADLQSARISLDRARRNLAYAEITSPIDGVVVERNVDVGQTVAASLSAPQLFLIADDLSKMQILAAVDESDIGQIKQGQDRARSPSRPTRTRRSPGTVRQVRLQSTTRRTSSTTRSSSRVENPDGQLLPGMTATVEFVVAKAAGRAPGGQRGAALPAHQADDAGRKRAEAGAARRGAPAAGAGRRGTAAVRRRRDSTLAGGAGAARRQRPVDRPQLWYLDEDGKLAVMPVRTGHHRRQGHRDRGPPQLEAGLQVIAGGDQRQGARRPSTTRSPFQQPAASSAASGGPPPGM